MTQPIDISGDRHEIHLVVDPETGPLPREFLRVSGAIMVLHRFDRDRFLLKRIRVLGRPPGGLFVLNIAQGQARYLLPDRDTEQVDLDDRTLYFVEVVKESKSGYRLGPSKEEGEVSTVTYPQPRYRLYAKDLDAAPPPRVVCGDPIERILAVREDGFWIILAGEPPELWRISRDGKGMKKVLSLTPGWVPSLLTHAFSPSGKRLALGVADRERFSASRDLLLIEIDSGAVIHRRDRINVRLPPWSSAIPSLEFVWLDEERLRFSETRVEPEAGFYWLDLEIPTGKVIGVTRYSGLDLWHEKPLRDSLEKYDQLELSLVDCVSFVVMKELGIEEAFTFDEDFRKAGFITLPRKK